MNVRRLLVATILAVMIGSTGIAVASDGWTAPAGPTLVIPAIHEGDAGSYTAGADILRFDFRVLPWMRPDGGEARGLTLTQEINTTLGSDTQRFWVERGAIQAALRRDAADASGIMATTDGEEDLALKWSFALFTTTYLEPAVPICGLIHGAQGNGPVGQGGVEVPGCGIRFRSSSVATDGRSQTWFGTAAEGVMLDERFPVPTKIHSAGRIWILETFHRGDAAPVTVIGAHHPVKFTRGELPDEQGIDHPFALSAALDAVMASPIPWNVASMLRDNPDAYLARAAFVEQIDGAQRRWQWDLTAADGVDEAKLRVWVDAPQADDGPLGAPVALPPLPVPRIEQVRSDEGPFPTKPAGPLTFVDLHTLTDRWDAIASPFAAGHGANGWGFHVHCTETCDVPLVETWVGLSQTRSDGSCDPGNLGGYTLLCQLLPPIPVRDLIGVDQNGLMLAHRSGDWSQNGHVNVAGTPLEVREDGQAGAAPVAAPLAASAFASSSVVAPAAASITLAAGLVGAIYYFWPQLKLGLFAGLRSMPLPENPNRESIQNVVQLTPGIHFQALSRATALAPGTLRHHLRILARQGRLVAYDVGGYKCYFTSRGFDRNVAASAGALKAESARRMLHSVVEDGSVTMGEAAQRSGIKPSSATHHALRLEQAGLLTRHRVGRHIELRPTAVAVRALATLQRTDT